jgi:hypothetical protein
MKLAHEFVKSVPEKLENGVLYISMEYRTAIHNCCCGCGEQVVTPFSPRLWKMAFDGKTISLYPSIGNWSFPCRSHYWITSSEVEWVPKWKDTQREKKESADNTRKHGHSFLRRLFGKRIIDSDMP